MAAKRTSKGGKGKGFGTSRQLASGKWQAFYTHDYERVTAPHTFRTKTEADAWRAIEHARVLTGTWISPKHRPSETKDFTFQAYAEVYLEEKRTSSSKPIEDSTKDLYRKVVKNQLGVFHGRDIRTITRYDVDAWHVTATANRRLSSAANAYKFLRALMNFAVNKGDVASNPCQVKGGQSGRTGRKEYTPTLAEVKLVASKLEPEFELLTLLATYGVLRFGEAAGLQKGDFKKFKGDNGEAFYKVHIQRQVKYFSRHFEVAPPKSAAGDRTTALHPSFTPMLEAYLGALPSKNSYLFQHNGGFLRNDHYERKLKKAIQAAGLDGLGWRVHSLRHAGATAYANQNANLAEVMAVLGDASPAAAVRYINQTGRGVFLSTQLEGL